jgi:hypothetical protein
MTMNSEERKKAMKHQLVVDKGLSFRERCAQAGIPRFNIHLCVDILLASFKYISYKRLD